MPDVHMLRLPEVSKRVGLKRSAIYKLMNDGKFPQSYKITDYAVAWRSDEIDQFIESRCSTIA